MQRVKTFIAGIGLVFVSAVVGVLVFAICFAYVSLFLLVFGWLQRVAGA